MQTTVATTAHIENGGAPKAPNFRPDIEGLRAVAILLVVLAHFSVPGFSAGFIGVDVFFAISGYLITGILVREYEANGKLDFMRFYANRLRRLLPALAIMLMFSSIAAFFLMPAVQNLAQSIAAAMAAFWASNLYFAFSDTNYFAAEASANLFLHTWSLGVEEQFYLVWPLLILLAAKFSRRENLARSLTILFVSVGAVSLIACCVLSLTKPTFAFYMMPTRMWQFCAGAMAWLMSRNGSAKAIHTQIIGIAGAILLIIAMLVIGPTTVYPGYAALLPTIGTCAMLYAGAQHAAHGGILNRLLSSSPMQVLGRISYAWYLWHWPVLILGESQFPIRGNLQNTLLAIGVSLALAGITHLLIENPIRFGRAMKAKKSWQIGIALIAMVLMNSQFLRWNTQTEKLIASDEITASYRAAAFSAPALYGLGCDDWYKSAQVKPCLFGNPKAPKTAVLMGDSIGAQWFPTIEKMLDPSSWKIIVLTKSSCPIVDEPFFYQRIGREYTECSTWRDQAIQWLQEQHIERIYLGSTASADFTDKQWSEGTSRILDRLSTNADEIYVIEANPQLSFNGPNCLMQQATPADGAENCKSPAENPQFKKVARLLQEAVSKHPKSHWIETSRFVCPNGTCAAIRDDIVVYRDQQHLTVKFTEFTAEHFRKQLQQTTTVN